MRRGVRDQKCGGGLLRHQDGQVRYLLVGTVAVLVYAEQQHRIISRRPGHIQLTTDSTSHLMRIPGTIVGGFTHTQVTMLSALCTAFTLGAASSTGQTFTTGAR